MGANGQLGKTTRGFSDLQNGRKYQVIGYFDGMTIVTTADMRPLSVPLEHIGMYGNQVEGIPEELLTMKTIASR